MGDLRFMTFLTFSGFDFTHRPTTRETSCESRGLLPTNMCLKKEAPGPWPQHSLRAPSYN